MVQDLHKNCCINGDFYSVFTYEVSNPKSGQILCAHEPCFLMPGHICVCMHAKKSVFPCVQAYCYVYVCMPRQVCFHVCKCVAMHNMEVNIDYYLIFYTVCKHFKPKIPK